MTHELEIDANGNAKMFYAGEVPWHGLGTQVDDAVTSADAMRLAGLDWEVELRPVYDGKGTELPRWNAVTRTTDDAVLGVIGKRYVLIQNREAFDFLDSLVQDGVLRYETAMSLFGGSQIAMLARMPEDMRIQDDVFAQYMLAATSHDASRSLSIYATNVRVVCNNTLTMATRAQAAAIISHTGNIADKMRAAREALNVTTQQQQRMAAWLQKLADTPIDEPTADGVRDAIFGPLDDATPTQRRNAIESFKSIYQAEVERCGENAYAFANAITGYADHKTRITIKGNRMQSMLDGKSAQLKKVGFAALTAATAIKL